MLLTVERDGNAFFWGFFLIFFAKSVDGIWSRVRGHFSKGCAYLWRVSLSFMGQLVITSADVLKEERGSFMGSWFFRHIL